jgi:hypothetical protein
MYCDMYNLYNPNNLCLIYIIDNNTYILNIITYVLYRSYFYNLPVNSCSSGALNSSLSFITSTCSLFSLLLLCDAVWTVSSGRDQSEWGAQLNTCLLCDCHSPVLITDQCLKAVVPDVASSFMRSCGGSVRSPPYFVSAGTRNLLNILLAE